MHYNLFPRMFGTKRPRLSVIIVIDSGKKTIVQRKKRSRKNYGEVYKFTGPKFNTFHIFKSNSLLHFTTTSLYKLVTILKI